MISGRPRSALALWVILFLFPCWGPNIALAQDTTKPALIITDVDIDSFPEVKIYVAGHDLGADLSKLQVVVKENRIERPVDQREVVSVGTQTVLILDASANINLPGITKDKRYVEVSNVVIRLLERKILAPENDWLAAYAPDVDGKLQPIKGWTRDHGGLRNALFSYKPPERIGATPLFNLIYFALDTFEQQDLDPAQQRSVIVFSDGVDIVSPLKRDDVVKRALEVGARVHTVMLGSGTREARSNLESIAIMTDGKFVVLDSVAALDGLWDDILGGRDQLAVSYRSASANPQEVVAVATLPDGRSLQASRGFPVVELKPVVVQFTEPAAETVITKTAPAYDTPLGDLAPQSLGARLRFTWPDGHPRRLKQVEYTVGNQVHVVTEEPFDVVALPIAALDSGSYSVKVRTIDELGITGEEGLPLRFSVKVDRPEAPPSEPVVTAIKEAVTEGRTLNYAALGLGALALLLALVLLFYFRKPERRERFTETVKRSWDDATAPFRLDRGKKQSGAVRARLVLLEGDGALPPVVDIRDAHTRLGRNPNLASLVIDDPRVSKYHCRIVEEADGTFRVTDEGSTSGTYVNYEIVPTGSGQVLHQGDILNIGPIAFRFEYGQGSEDATVTDETLKMAPSFPEQHPSQPHTDPDVQLSADEMAADSDETATAKYR
ncbi:MAG: FHA domain-containing protein [Ardenticatenia bacterium]|nr:FHA domain-containing protein [Ardenticatenia bacterium]